MKIRVLTIAGALALLSLPTQAVAVASADPLFGPGNWGVDQPGPYGPPERVSTWRAVADCGAGCLTVTGKDDVSGKFTQQPDGTWAGNWRVTDGECFDDFGNILPETATWTSNFVVNSDLTVNNHVQDEVGCDGGRGSYDESYTLTSLPSPESTGL